MARKPSEARSPRLLAMQSLAKFDLPEQSDFAQTLSPFCCGGTRATRCRADLAGAAIDQLPGRSSVSAGDIARRHRIGSDRNCLNNAASATRTYKGYSGISLHPSKFAAACHIGSALSCLSQDFRVSPQAETSHAVGACGAREPTRPLARGFGREGSSICRCALAVMDLLAT